MARRDYQGAGITVHWDAEICEHAAACVRGAPEVFDTARRPWIDASAAAADRIAEVVDRCPSRALTYTRSDGVAPGPNGLVAGDDPLPSVEGPATGPPAQAGPRAARITARQDGPLVVEGPVALDDGTEVEVGERLFLCRCGASAAKPRCDGSHKRVGFEAPGAPVPRKP